MMRVMNMRCQDENPSDTYESYLFQLRKYNRSRKSSTIYDSNDYVTLTNKGEPKCFLDTMESEEN